MSSGSSWLSSEAALLERLWNEDVPAKEISLRLEKRTKNSVIGMAHRMGLKKRQNIIVKRALAKPEPTDKSYHMMLVNRDEFTAMWNRGENIVYIAHYFGAKNNDIVRRVVRTLGLKERMPHKSKTSYMPVKERIHGADSKLAKETPIGDMKKAHPLAKGWFAESGSCCQYLALPNHKYCHLHSGSELNAVQA